MPNLFAPRSRPTLPTPYRLEGSWKNVDMLIIKEAADIMRCFKYPRAERDRRKVSGLPKLTHLSIRRRVIIRRDWLAAWVEANKSSKVQGLNW